MLKGLRPPTHRADAPGILILPHDDAWDHERIEAEADECEAQALAAMRVAALPKFAEGLGLRVDQLDDAQRAASDASCVLTDEERSEARLRHPVSRYLAGHTRFQLDATDQGPHGPTCARACLRTDGEPPSTFELRRIPGRERARIEATTHTGGDWCTAMERWVRLGLASVNAGDLQWRAERPTDRVPDDIFDAICDASGGALINLIALAGACKRFSEGLSDAEGKR